MREYLDAQPLHFATTSGHLSVVEFLLKHGAPVDAICTVEWKKADAVFPLRRKFRVMGRKSGFTPLILCKDVRCAEALLKHGANINHQTGEGTTVLMRAAERGPLDLLFMLLVEGANHSIEDVTKKTFYNYLENNRSEDMKGSLEIFHQHFTLEETR